MIRLPAEILWELTRYCGQRDLYALSLTCAFFRMCIQLYSDRHVVVKSGSQMYDFLQVASEGVTAASSGLFGRDREPQRRLAMGVRTRKTSGARYARVRSLTIKGVAPAAATTASEDDEKQEEFDGLVRQVTGAGRLQPPFTYYLSSPLNLAALLLPNLTCLHIYEPDMRFTFTNITCLAAWAPGLKVLHLYKHRLEAILLEHILALCPRLEELEVSGLTLEKVIDLVPIDEDDDEDQTAEEEEEEQDARFLEWAKICESRSQDLAVTIVGHPNLRHFASDRRNMTIQPQSAHGILLNRLGAMVDKLSTPTSIGRLQSLELRDDDFSISELISYLSKPASANIRKLYLDVKDLEGAVVSFDSEWLPFCHTKYTESCFFSATTDLQLACNTGLFPLAFFQRVGHRIKSLRVLSTTKTTNESDSILLSLQSQVLPSLKKLFVTVEAPHKKAYTDLLAAAIFHRDPPVHFCIDDKDSKADDKYKRRDRWDRKVSSTDEDIVNNDSSNTIADADQEMIDDYTDV